VGSAPVRHLHKMPYPQPTEVDPKLITTHDPTKVKQILQKHGVVVIPLKSITTAERDEAVNATKFYQNANAILQEPIPEPTLKEKLNPATYAKRRAPDGASGMIHQYFTPIHHLLENDKQLRATFDTLFDRNTIYAPNRLRVTTRFKFDDNSLHIEGKDIFEKDADGTIRLLMDEVACIAAVAGTRRFVFWDMNGADLTAIYEMWSVSKKNFTKIPPAFMNEHYPGRRRMVTVDCAKHPSLIVWSESTPHEIALSPALSAFISPIERFNTAKVKTTCTYHPSSYRGLTKHESNLLGCCYNLPGYEWPSGKTAYPFCHARAYGFYLDRVQEEYTRISPGGRRIFRIPDQGVRNGGAVNQKDPGYQRKLRERGIKLPARAFEAGMPHFTVDLLQLPDHILKGYGFIPVGPANSAP